MHITRISKHNLEKWIPYLVIVLMVISIVAFQITHHFFINGVDTFFHMSVAYDAARQIQTGHFSYFLSAYGFYHSLRIVNAVYGPLGGYFSGFLLLIMGSWIRWQIATFVIVFTIAGVAMYQLCRYWHVTRTYSVLVSCLYMFSYPLMSMWLNSQYDGVGAAFMPWILYFGSRILNRDDFKNWKLVLLLVILAELHVFSMLLGLLVLALCYGASVIIHKQNPVPLTIKGLKVLLITIMLSFNVWGGIIEVLRSNSDRIIPTYSMTNMFKNVWSSIFYNPQVPVNQNVFLLGLSTTVLLGITLIGYIFSVKHLNGPLNFITLFLGLGFLILSSRLIPWPLLQHYFPILNTDLQFPKRFLPVALTALGLILAVLLTKLQHYIPNQRFAMIVITILMGMFVLHAWQNTQYQSQYLNHEYTTTNYYHYGLKHSTGDTWMRNQRHPQRLVDSLRGHDYGRYFQILTKGTPDYLPSNRKILTDKQYHQLGAYSQYYKQIISNPLRYRSSVNHHTVTVTFNRHSAKPITLPFVKYAHTQVTVNGRSMAHPHLTKVGAIKMKPRTGRNVLTFKYVPSRWYMPLMWLSILVWICFIVTIVIELF